MQLAYVLVDENHEIISLILRNFYKHFPNKKAEIEHYCLFLNFGKCGEEYETPEDFYDRLNG